MTEAEVRRVLALMPSDCFIRLYCEYAERQTAGNLGFSLGVALALVGTVAPRNLIMKGLKRRTIPNVYVLVVGPSGAAEKSVTVDVGEDLFMEVAPDLRGDDPTADESLLKSLHTKPVQLWIYSELAGFLSKTGGLDQRGRGIRDAFMEAFDGKSKGRQYSRGPRVFADNPRPCFLGACTPRHLEDHTSGMDWEGGFMSRFLIFSGAKERHLPWPSEDEGTRNLYRWLANWMTWSLTIGSEGSGAGESLGLSGAAQRRWLLWEKELQEKHLRQYTDERLQGIISRSSLQAAKCALLVSWASGHCVEPWTLKSEALEAGIAIAELTLAGTLELAANIEPTPEMREQRRLYNSIGDDWTALGDALREAKLTKRKGSIYVETLMEQGVIMTTTQGSTSYFKRSRGGTQPYDYGLDNLPPPPDPRGGG